METLGPERASASRWAAEAGLALALACGAAALMIPLAYELLPAKSLPPPFPDQHQRAEDVIFLFTFLIALPAALFAVPRLAARIDAAGNGAGLGAMSLLLLAGLALVGVLNRISEGGLIVLATATLVWWLAAGALLAVAVRVRPSPALARLATGGRALAIATALAVAALLLSFTDLGEVSVPLLVAGLLGAVAIVLITARFESQRARIGRRAVHFLDLAAAGLLFLAVVNLVVFTPEDPAANLQTAVIHFHQNFFLGPANHVLAGDAMLVDTFSQYGVGSIYMLAGAFQVIPIGNGTLGLIDGSLSAATFVAAFAICRICGVSWLLAVGAFAAATVALTYGLDYPLGGLLQHGGIRFGMPMLLLLAGVAEARWRERLPTRRAAQTLQLATVALSAVWALESFIYVTATAVALVAVGALLEPAGRRRRYVLRRAGAVLVAWLLAHLLLAALTLALGGSLPRWGAYLDTLRAFLGGPIGDLTYDFAPFSPALLVAAAYIASVTGLATLWRGSRALLLRERTTILAIAGGTAYGVTLFSYFVNRSADHILPYVCLPVVLVAVLWLALVSRTAELGGRRTGRLALGAGVAVAALAVSVAAGSAATRFEQSALGIALPGGNSPRAAMQRLWNPPPLAPAAPMGARLLETYMPGENRSVVITDPDLGIEALVRADRANALPLADPWEESFVADQYQDELSHAVAELEPGDRMLIDAGAAEGFEELLADPDRDPLVDPIRYDGIVPNGLASLQQLALKEIGERFRLRSLATGEGGLEIVELVPR